MRHFDTRRASELLAQSRDVSAEFAGRLASPRPPARLANDFIKAS